MPELMDQPSLDSAEHNRALQGLARINRLSHSDAMLWPAIERLARSRSGAAIRVLDVATGGGDVPIALAKRTLRAGLAVEIEGCDVSPDAVQFARQRAEQSGLKLRFSEMDVRSEPIPEGFDIITCSLFLHHLDEPEARSFMRKAADATSRLLLVNDLIRGPAGYLLAWTGCRFLSRSPVVWHDGPVSVAGAFSLAEVRKLAASAGLEGVSLTRHWPCRFLLSWSR